jgi:integrase
MARNLLTARAVQTAGEGTHTDGDGLELRIAQGGARGSWAFRYTSPSQVAVNKDGIVQRTKRGEPLMARREVGLGPVVRSNVAEAGKSLTVAREQAEGARKLIREGIDPIEAKKKQRAEAEAAERAKKFAAKAERATLARVARDYHERVIEPNRTTKHAAQWIASLETHVPARFWHTPIDTLTAPPLLDFFIDVRSRVPETASRIMQRLRAIFSDAEFRGLCKGNPADAAAKKIKELRLEHKRGQFAALPYAEVPAFMVELRKREAIAARALEFAVLTSARTGEVIGATWGEFDLEGGLWIVPAERMKGGEAHTVYLSPRAAEIVESMRELGSAFVFPTPEDTQKPLSNMAMLTLLRRMDSDKRTTVHGLCRASFSTWANETGAARPDVIEACQAHREQDRVRRAYNRAQFAQERRALLHAWADYCAGLSPVASNVLPLVRAA